MVPLQTAEKGVDIQKQVLTGEFKEAPSYVRHIIYRIDLTKGGHSSLVTLSINIFSTAFPDNELHRDVY